jgi:hypothetical protein
MIMATHLKTFLKIIAVGSLGLFAALQVQAQMISLPQWAPPKALYDINFIASKSIPSTLSFSRASTGTYYNSAGTLTTAASGVARFDYDPSNLSYRGLLLEPSATNYVPYSENLSGGSNWYNQQTVLTANATTAPDGTNTASMLAEAAGAGNNQHNSMYYEWPGGPANVSITASIFLKAGTLNQVELFLSGRPGVWSSFVITMQGAGIMTTTGAANGLGSATNYGIQYVGNGWYRAFITIPNDSSGNGLCFLTRIYNNGSSWYDAGAGGGSVYLWGVQYEAGSVPTSYIKTTGASATRAADQLTFASTSLYNKTGGTLFAQFINAGIENGANYRAFGFFGSNVAGTFSQNEISIADQGTATTSAINAGGVTQYSPSGTLYSPGYVNYAALAYTTGSYAYSVNGSAAVTINTGSLPSASPVYGYIGSQPDGNMRVRWIQKVQYYNQRTNNLSLANLSKTDCAHGSLTFTSLGSDQTFTVPTGCTKFFVQAWGAGGGGTQEGDGNGQTGGAGGYTSGYITGTGSFTVIVGSGGGAGDLTASYGGGGASGGPSGGDGGGRSAISLSGTDLLTAGGGGGAGYGGTTGYSGTAENGGSGGGLVGLGVGGSMSGGPGTQSAGGAAGSCCGGTAGIQYIGGIGASTWTGGGGGGWYGGGGGTSAFGDGGGGGGGSGYVGGAGVTLGASISSIVGNPNPPVQDGNYQAGVGVGGITFPATAGGGGLVVITY